MEYFRFFLTLTSLSTEGPRVLSIPCCACSLHQYGKFYQKETNTTFLFIIVLNCAYSTETGLNFNQKLYLYQILCKTDKQVYDN